MVNRPSLISLLFILGLILNNISLHFSLLDIAVINNKKCCGLYRLGLRGIVAHLLYIVNKLL